jgi:arylsulfatase
MYVDGLIKSKIDIEMKKTKTLLCLLGILIGLSSNTSNAQTNDKPNIVIMMVDNLGWGELGCYGGGELRGAATPELDKMAAEGMLLQNFNVEPQCTPTRSAFMTGRRPIRSGTTKVVWGMLYGMTNWEITLAELLSDAGYATGMFGKWHMELPIPLTNQSTHPSSNTIQKSVLSL